MMNGFDTPTINVGTLREMLAQPEVLWRQMAAMSAAELCLLQVERGWDWAVLACESQ